MPIKPNNTDKLKNKPGEEESNPLSQQGDVERDGDESRYGRIQELKFNPDADVTQPQEYKGGGLPRTESYSVQKGKKETTQK